MKPQHNVSLEPFSTLKLSAIARYFIEVKNIDDCIEALNWAQKSQIRIIFIGNGSNILFLSSFYDALVIKNSMTGYFFRGTTCVAESGCLLPKLAFEICKKGYAGLEFAAGIPATLGGAVAMNAGAFGSEMKSVVESVDVFSNGDIVTYSNSDIEFCYRSSKFLYTDECVLSVNLVINSDMSAHKRFKANAISRSQSQPLNQISAGCCFKNIDSLSAGKIIDDMGLKGFSIGGASISMKHANYVINDGSASSTDILQLIEYIEKRAFEKGYSLVREIRVIE